MKRSLLLISLLIITIALFFNACSNKSDTVSLSFFDNDASSDERYFGIISEFSCGFLSNNTPLHVKFNNDVKLKKSFEEVLSSKTFVITPNVQGTAYWIDDHTIGYKFDKAPKNDTKYNVKFNVAEFVDIPNEAETLEFVFMLRKQDFKIINNIYFSNKNTSCSYSFDIQFTNPIEPDIALSVLDQKISDNYNVSSSALSPSSVRLSINDIKRDSKEKQMTFTFNGEKIDIKKSISIDVPIPANEDFKIVGYYLNYSEKLINIQFSNPLQINQSLNGFIEVSNNKSFKTNINDNSLLLYFDNDGNHYDKDTEKSFSISINPNISDIYNNSTVDVFTISDIIMEELLPEAKWTEDGVIIPTIDSTMVYFNAIALKSVMIRFIKIYDHNILNFLQDNELDDTWSIRKVGRLEKKIHLQLNTNDYDKWKTYAIRLSDYITVNPGDMYQISINFDVSDYAFACDSLPIDNNKTKESDYWDNNEYNYKTYYYGDYWWERSKNPCFQEFYNDVEIKKNILVTNLAVTAKSAYENDLDVFVRNIIDASPSNKTTVTAYNYQLTEIGHSVTDALGHCHLTCSNFPYFIIASDANGNKSYLKLEKNKSLSLSKFDISGNSVNNNINGFIYSNRDVWRPGDSIFINFILNDKNSQLPQNFPVIFELLDCNNRLYCKKVNNQPVGNIYSFSTATNPDDVTGKWFANIKVGNNTFTKSVRVETVKPNRLEINFKVPEIIYLSQNRPLNLKAQWLNGLQASGLSASVDVTLTAASTTFKNYPEYSFDNEAVAFYPTNVTLFSSNLDANGSKNISVNPLESINAQGFLNAKFTIKVFEQSGDFSISTSHCKLSPYSRYIGVSLPEPTSVYGDYYFTGRNWNFPVVVVNENGTTVRENTTLDYSLYKLDSYWWWSNNNNELSAYTSGTYYKPVINNSIYCSEGKANFNINIADNKWGAYLLVIKDLSGDCMFSKVLYFDSEYYSGSSSLANAPAIIKLTSDKETYKVGEKINISFPANEQAQAIVTIESASRILQTIDLGQLSKSSVLTFVATEEMAPNIYVYLSLIQRYNSGNDLPVRMYGVLPLNIEPKNSTLEPLINMPETANSNQDVDIIISEKNGKSMYYTIAVVDEGILGLTSYKTADPYKYFFSKQALNIRTWDNYNNIIDAYTGEMLSVFATGGDMTIIPPETTLSERFSAVAYSYGPFKLDAGKSVTHKVHIPEYIGALRTMVVASDGINAYGSTQKDIKVSNPLMIIPTAPRIIATGDKFTMPVQVLSPDNPGKNVKLHVTANNLNIINPDIELTLSKSGDAMANFDISTLNVSGTSEITVKGTIGSFSSISTVKIPIRVPSTTTHDVVTKEITPNQKEDFIIDVQGIPGTAVGNITVNSLIPLDLRSRIDYLISYPFGCLEQVISTAFPQLYLESLTTLDDKSKAEAKDDVDAAITKLNGYLRSDYSLTNWKNGNYVNPWTEIYAAHFLIEAKNAGFNVQSEMLKGIMKYQAAKAKAWSFNSDHPTDDVIQAYRLFVLALNNTAETGAMNKLQYLDNLQPLSKALLASSYALTGKTNIARELIPTIDYNSTNYLSNYYISYGSKIRDIAFCTYAEMLCNSEDQYIRKYIDQIAQALSNNQWFDTQTIAMSLFVLEQYALKKGFQSSPIDAIVVINDSEDNINSNKPSVSQSFNPKSSNKISVTNNSKSSIYVSIYTKSTSADYTYTEKGNGYAMNIKYIDKNNNSIDVSSLDRNTDFFAEITVTNTYDKYPITEDALSYFVPAGWEIVNDRLFGKESGNEALCNHIDMRDDRIYFFFDLKPAEKKTFKIALNASFKGSYTIPPVTCEDMYNDAIFYTIPAKKVVVR